MMDVKQLSKGSQRSSSYILICVADSTKTYLTFEDLIADFICLWSSNDVHVSRKGKTFQYCFTRTGICERSPVFLCSALAQFYLRELLRGEAKLQTRKTRVLTDWIMSQIKYISSVR